MAQFRYDAFLEDIGLKEKEYTKVESYKNPYSSDYVSSDDSEKSWSDDSLSYSSEDDGWTCTSEDTRETSSRTCRNEMK